MPAPRDAARPAPDSVSVQPRRVRGHAEVAVRGQAPLEHLRCPSIIAGAATIQQHPGVQPVRSASSSRLRHLLGDLAGDGEVTFGFLPPTSRRGGETSTGLHEPAVEGDPSITPREHPFEKWGQCSRLLVQTTQVERLNEAEHAVPRALCRWPGRGWATSTGLTRRAP